METPKIADKVKFWEEQDRINRELIPRVLKQHELLTAHVERHPNADLEARAQVQALEERITAEVQTAKLAQEQDMAAAIRTTRLQALAISIASLAIAIVALGLSLT